MKSFLRSEAPKRKRSNALRDSLSCALRDATKMRNLTSYQRSRPEFISRSTSTSRSCQTTGWISSLFIQLLRSNQARGTSTSGTMAHTTSSLRPSGRFLNFLSSCESRSSTGALPDVAATLRTTSLSGVALRCAVESETHSASFLL
jgi:hypothetical protein